MDTLQILRDKRREILQIAAKHGAQNIRVFGSAVRGDDRPGSDVDFLIDRASHTSPWFPAGFVLELEQVLNRPVDVVIEKGLNPYIREYVLREAISL